jgi:tetratricopeptide (TPR) repeat protein
MQRKKGRREDALDARLRAAAEAYRRGDLAAAEKMCREVLKARPGFAQALLILGTVLGQTGRVEAAVPLLSRAAIAAPGNPDVHYSLGMALMGTGKWAEAREAFATVTRLGPGHPFAHNNLGIAQRRLDDLASAIHSFESATRINPKNLEAWINLALCLVDAGRATRALDLCDRLVARGLRQARVHVLRSRALLKLGRFREALDGAMTAKTVAPHDKETLLYLGSVYRALGRVEEAIGVYEEGRGLGTGEVDFTHNLAVALREAGRMDAAEDAFRAALALDPNVVAPWYHLARLKRFAAGDPDIAAMEEVLSGLAPGTEGRMQVSYALGKAWEDSGDFERAFAYYEDANRIARSLHPPDLDQVEADHDLLRDIFGRDRLRSGPRETSPAVTPIFIVGMPRSGTTLVEQMLASHPKVRAGGELSLLRDLALDVVERVPAGLAKPTGDELGRIGDSYVSGLRDLLGDLLGDGAYATDKMPRNFELLGLIAEALPKARIVHCRRDSLDTCLSCYTLDFAGSQRFSNDLADLGRAYRLYERLMDHWRAVLPEGRMIEVAYEDLVAEPRAQAERLLAHCGLEWDEACLTFHETRRAIRTASAEQARRPIYASSIGRWKKFEAQLGPLRERLEGKPSAGGAR